MVSAMMMDIYAARRRFHWSTAGIPNMWKPFAICDLVFTALFVWAYVSVGRETGGAGEARAEKTDKEALL
jgi:hypothetical protein